MMETTWQCHQTMGLGDVEANPCHLQDYLICLSHGTVKGSKYKNPSKELELEVLNKLWILK